MTIMRSGLGVLVGCAIAVAAVSTAHGDPVKVRYTEGVARGFPVLRAQSGDALAQGDFVQVAHPDRVENRLIFKFRDGSLYDETVTFDQRDAFSLLAYRIVQRGPSFPESLEASIDRASGRYHVRYRSDADSPEETVSGQFEMPSDVYNGLLSTLLKNLVPGASQVVHIVAFTPRPRLVKMLLRPVVQEPVSMGSLAVPATRYHIKPQLGLLASLLVSDLPEVKTWIARGEAPAFLRFEGPLFFMGPVWRIDWN